MKKLSFLVLTVLLFHACTPMDNPRVPLYGITLDKENLSIGFGTTYKLNASVTPERTTDKLILVWESDDPSIVEVDQDGVLRGKEHGDAIISVTATLSGKSYTATCTVEVIPVVVNIPDEVFRNYCLQIADFNDDGILTSDETVLIKTILIGGLGVASLDGIQFFSEIEHLNCANNQLTVIDLSQNTALLFLFCSNNKLTALNLSQNRALRRLECFVNQLTSLDVSENTALERLSCYNNQLSSLDVSHNTVLERLNCDMNKLTVLDVSHNNALTVLDCANNLLTTLDVSQNTLLRAFYCENNQLTALDCSQNGVLIQLTCDNNLLISLDVSGCTALQTLSCCDNNLTTLDLNHNTELQLLVCQLNLFTSLDLSHNLDLTTAYCSINSLLTEIWLKIGQSLYINKDSQTVINYK